MLLAIDDIAVGDSYTEEVEFTPAKTAQFLSLTQDTAAIHTVEEFSREKGYDNLVVYGFLLSLHFSRILGMELPGENTVIGAIQMEFHEPVYVGDTVTYTATVRRIIKPLGLVALDLDARKKDGTVCVQGKTTCAFKQ
jgi:3-hydroxybutyryl-CoA dehydratase